MEISERLDGGVAILQVTGDVSGEGMADLEKRIEVVLERRTRRLVLELSAIRFLPGEAIEVLLRIVERSERLGVCLRLAAVTPAVRRILHLTRLDRRLELDATPEDALERAREQPLADSVQFFGEYLMEQGAIGRDQLKGLLDELFKLQQENRSMRLGVLLVQRELLTREQVQQHLLDYWRRREASRR